MEYVSMISKRMLISGDRDMIKKYDLFKNETYPFRFLMSAMKEDHVQNTG